MLDSKKSNINIGLKARATARALKSIVLSYSNRNELFRVHCTHHKCASKYQGRLLGALIGESKIPGGLYVFKGNGVYQKDIKPLKRRYKGIHVIRDPRDILVSGYFSHKYSHPILSDEDRKYRDWLNSVSKEEGLMFEITHGGYRPAECVNGRSVMQDLSEWDYGNPDILELKMEDFVKDAHDILSRVARHFEIEVDRDAINRYIEANSFKKLSGGRDPGAEDNKSHYRKGKSGDWKEHFSPEHLKAFETKWGYLLPLLGYER